MDCSDAPELDAEIVARDEQVKDPFDWMIGQRAEVTIKDGKIVSHEWLPPIKDVNDPPKTRKGTK